MSNDKKQFTMEDLRKLVKESGPIPLDFLPDPYYTSSPYPGYITQNWKDGTKKIGKFKDRVFYERTED